MSAFLRLGFLDLWKSPTEAFPVTTNSSESQCLVQWPSSQRALIFQKAILAEDFEDVGFVMVMLVRLACVVLSSLPQDHQKITNWTSQCIHTEGSPRSFHQWSSNENRWRANTCQPTWQGMRQTHTQAAPAKGAVLLTRAISLSGKLD